MRLLLLPLAERSSALPGESGSEGTRATNGLPAPALLGEGVVAVPAAAAAEDAEAA